jgi:NAD(P)-dependent dehydrogenase (short-subunit alcohol dehydrogenase family)
VSAANIGSRRRLDSAADCRHGSGMTQQLILVTGATDGIGRETARELTRRGARVLVHGRNEERARATAAELAELGAAAAPEPVLADLASLAEVRALADEIDARGHRLDAVVHNAGVYMKRHRRSADGHEMTFAVNHLAPFLLTHLLLARACGAGLRRIVNVSSIAHSRGRVDLDDPQLLRQPFSSYASYATSKLANVLFTVELARRLAGRNVAVNALHPGVASTKLLTEGFEMEGSDSLAESAATSVLLAVDPTVEGVTGRYFVRGRPSPANPVASDPVLVRRFYELSAELTGVDPLPG